MRKARLLLIFAAIIAVSLCKIIQVPPVSSDQPITLRLDQSSRIDNAFKTFGNLTHVYRKEVQEVVDGKEVDFSPCSEEPPETSFWGDGFKSISGNTTPKGLVFDFAKIQYPRNLIDMAFYNGRLYYMLEDGEVKVNLVSSDFTSLKDHATHKTSEANIAKGSFVILPTISSGLFVNHNQAAVFGLGDDSFSAISQYQKKSIFELAVALQGKYFAVAYGTEGLRIYSVNLQDKTLKVEYELNKDNSGLNNINIKGMTYDSGRKILFIVDYISGLLSLQLSFNNGLSAQLTSSSKKIRQCNLVYYDRFNDELYLNCREIHKFRINNWPVIDEKVLPRQEISVKDITSTSSMVALIGRDIFELLIADRKAAIYEDSLLDKLILTQGNFISANQDGILTGRYTISPPTLRCSTRDASKLGTHRLVLKVTAQCNADYFAATAFSPGTLSKDDKCVYTLYKSMSIWQPAAINTKPFMVIGILLGLLGLGVMVWWAYSYLSFRRLKNYCDNYQNLEEEGRGTEREDKKEGANNNSQEQGVSGTNEKIELKEKEKEKEKEQQPEIQSEEMHYDIQ